MLKVNIQFRLSQRKNIIISNVKSLEDLISKGFFVY
jgi:hypothetical protein